MSKARSSQRASRRTTLRDSSNPANPQGGKRVERQSQMTLQMRRSLHQELARKAFESGMTMRGYIMRALQKTGLDVTEADLIDRRRRE